MCFQQKMPEVKQAPTPVPLRQVATTEAVIDRQRMARRRAANNRNINDGTEAETAKNVLGG